MSATNVFGPIVTGGLVERKMKAHLELWLDSYLGEMERIEGYAVNAIARPRGYFTTDEFFKAPEVQVPAVLILSSGLAGPPERRGGGIYAASWAVGVAPIVEAPDDESVRKLAHTYTAAIRAAVMQHKSLGGFAETVYWRDEVYSDLPPETFRTMRAGRTVFEVVVGQSMRETGPVAPLPPTPDPGPWPTATDVDAGVELVPITGDVQP